MSASPQFEILIFYTEVFIRRTMEFWNGTYARIDSQTHTLYGLAMFVTGQFSCLLDLSSKNKFLPYVQERCRVKQMFQEKHRILYTMLDNKVRPTEKKLNLPYW
jgi:hypothetical protein